MAKHSDFIDHIAMTFGESLNTVKLAHRLLREAGHIEGGRGKHAPQRCPADAAAFLCWMGVTDRPTLAPAVFEDFGGISIWGGRPLPEGHPLKFLGLADNHTLAEALAALITAEISGLHLPIGYTIEFAADELNVGINSGADRALYTREDDPHEADYRARYGRPFRVVRTFPREFIRDLARIFQADDVQSEAA
jgi:hypothetical protein